MGEFRIVSSSDSSFAVENLLDFVLSRARKDVVVCTPWIEKGFVSLLRRTVSPDVSVSLLTKVPQENDKTFCAIQALEALNTWKTNIICAPWLHAKFFVVDSKDVVFGSANATGNGFYYNNEVLMSFEDMPEVAARFLQIFSETRSQLNNIRWSLVRDYSGCSYYSTSQLKIMQLVDSFFTKNNDLEVPLPSLQHFLENNGYKFEVVKMTIKEMLRNGSLYEPCSGYVKRTPT